MWNDDAPTQLDGPAKQCAVCAQIAPLDAKFCGSCGTAFPAPAPPPQDAWPTMPMSAVTAHVPNATAAYAPLPPPPPPASAPYPPMPTAPAPGVPRKTSKLPLVIGGIAALAVIGLVAALGVPALLARFGPPSEGAGAATPSAAVPVPSTTPSSADTPAPQPTVTVTVAEQPQPATTVVVVPDAPVQKQTYPTVYVTEGKECSRTGSGPFAASGTANASTSCAFAINVRDAYVNTLNGGSGTIRAYSPTTKLWYDMQCSGSQPVLCTGGKAGRVIIYGGQLRVG